MPVVGYVPPEEAPEPMAFFSYGCCISTSQALWVLITTFIVAIIMVILCATAAIFVRWVYKRRMRKKIEALKERYHKEEREKHEREQDLQQIAKRPVVPRPQLPPNEQYKQQQSIMYQQPNPNMFYLWQQQQQAAQDLEEQTAKDVGAVPSFDRALQPPERGEMVFDGERKMEKMSLMVEPATVAGVIHEMAKGDMTPTPDQKPYPHIALGCAQKELEPTQPDAEYSSSYESRPSKTTVSEPSKKEESTEEPIKELPIQKTQENSPEAKLDKKSSKSRKVKQNRSPSPRGPSEDFPYYRPKKSLTVISKATTDESVSYQSTQKTGITPSPPKIEEPTKRPEPNVKTYNVYELRRLADEQAGMAETEEACEMIRNRNPMEGQKKLDLGQPVTKRIAQIQNPKDVKMEIQSPPSP